MLKIYLDTNVWCRPFDEQRQKRIIEEGEAFFNILEKTYYEHKFRIIGSSILEDEIEQIEEKEKKEAVKALTNIFVYEKIEKFSRSLQKEIKKVGLKDKDALHLAFAINNSEYFISVDDEILNKRKEMGRQYGIKVRNPVEFMKEVK